MKKVEWIGAIGMTHYITYVEDGILYIGEREIKASC